ncbi:MAG: hypothetical protein ACKOOI_00470, partial [Pirellula sp.]
MQSESSTKRVNLGFWRRFFLLAILWPSLWGAGLGQTPFPSTTPGTLPPTASYPSSPDAIILRRCCIWESVR